MGDVGGLGVGVAEDERRGGQDQQLLVAAPVLGQPALDVGVERLALLQRAVPGEDRIGAAAANSRPWSESPAWKMTGLPCGLRGTLNRPLMSKCASE